MTHPIALLLVELCVLMSTAILGSFFYHDEIKIIYMVWVVVACLYECCSTAVEYLNTAVKITCRMITNITCVFSVTCPYPNRYDVIDHPLMK